MNKNLLRKTFRDLKLNWAQSLALVVIVALGMLSFVAAAGAFRDLDSSYQRTYDETNFADVTFAVAGMPTSVLEQIREIPGVDEVTGRLVIDSGYQLPDGNPIRSRLIGIPSQDHPAVNDVLLLEGQYFSGEGGPTVLLESHFADYYSIGVGDLVTPIVNGEERALTVSGIVASPEYLIVSASRQNILPSARSFAVLFLPLEALQAAVEMEDTVNDVAVLIDEGEEIRPIIDEIEAVLTPYQLESTILQEDQPSNAALTLDLEGFREIAFLMPIILLLVAAASIYIMLGRMVMGQQQQIGLMKALGYSNGAVSTHYLIYTIIIGVIGTIIGLVVGLLLARQLTTLYAQELGIPLVESRFYLDLVLIGGLLSLGFAAAAGIGPARGAAKLMPAEAMYFDPSAIAIVGRRPFFERWVRLPLSVRLPIRNVMRVRRRTLSNVIGIIFAFILILMTYSWLDSMASMLDQTFVEIARWDITVLFNSPQNENVIDEISSWEGVKAIEPAIVLPASVSSGNNKVDVLLTAFDPEQDMHVLKLTENDSTVESLAPGKVILTEPLMNELGMAIGDDLRIRTQLGEKTLTLSDLSDEMSGEVAYVSTEELLAGTDNPVFNYLYLQGDEESLDSIKNDLYHLPGAAVVQSKSEVRSDVEQFIALFNAFTGVMVVLALVMAFALLFNAMTVSVLERQRELATMRAIGAPRGSIAQLLAMEIIITWLIALIPGMVLGYYVAVQVGKSFSSELFVFNIVINPATFIVTAIGILITMLLAAWPAFRRINRLNLAEATKILA
ncbi:MAG: ABC transporter permease [Anaerolineae bacterium]|nr:MAG: ABC transporter permease [Anaerolineae bacterium]